MKECELKFIIDENLITKIAKRFEIDLSDKDEANRRLEEFVREYMTTQIRISEKVYVKITDK